MLKHVILVFMLLFSQGFMLLAQEEDDECLWEPRLTVAKSGIVTPGQSNNIRAEPSTSAEIIGEIPGRRSFTVFQGPVCADGYNWWRVSYNGTIGWMADGTAEEPWVESINYYCEPHLVPNQPARLDYVTLDVFEDFNSQSNVLITIPTDGEYQVGSEFVCIRGTVWVEATYEGVTGWVTDTIIAGGVYDTDLFYGDSEPELYPVTGSITVNHSEPLPNAITAQTVSALEYVRTIGDGGIHGFDWTADGTFAVYGATETQVYSLDNLDEPIEVRSRFESSYVSRSGLYRVEYPNDTELIVYDAMTNESLISASGQGISVFFSPEGTLFAVREATPDGESSNKLTVYDGATELYTIDAFSWVAFRGWINGRLFISSNAGDIIVLDAQSGQEIARYDPLFDWQQLRISEDGERIVVLMRDCGGGGMHIGCVLSLALWDVSTNVDYRSFWDYDAIELNVVNRTKYDFDFHPSYGFFFALQVGEELFWLDQNYRIHLQGEFGEGVANVASFDFSPDGSLIAVGTTNGEIRLLDITEPYGANGINQVSIISGIPGDVTRVAFSQDGLYIAAYVSDSSVRVWDMATLTELAIYQSVPIRTPIALSPDNSTFAARTTYWDIATGQPTGSFDLPFDVGYASAAYTRDGLLILRAVRDGQFITLWNAETGELWFELPFDVQNTLFNPQSNTLAYTSWSDVLILDATTRDVVNVLTDYYGITAIEAFSYDGQYVMVKDWGIRDNVSPMTMIRNVATGELVFQHEAIYGSYVWSRDNRWLVMSRNREIFISDLLNNETRQLTIPDGFSNMTIDPNSTMLLLVSPAGEFIFIDLATAEILERRDSGFEQFTALFFSDDGTSLYGLSDSALHVWQINQND